MRVIQPDTFKVYQLHELTPEAREKALNDVATKMVGDWWEQSDTDEVTATMIYRLATALGSPGTDTTGPDDFNGIRGVDMQGWDLDRADSIAVRGILDRANAPALAWSDGVMQVNLHNAAGYRETAIDVETSEEDLDPDDEMDLTVLRYTLTDLADIMEQQVRDALSAAKQAGRELIEHIGSAENAERYIEANDREFHEDGTLYW